MKNDVRREIEGAVENWLTAWEQKNVRLAVKDYAEDADWINAFGRVCKGRADLEETIGEIFSQPYVMAGRDSLVGQEIRIVGRDVAVATTRIERTGQLTPSGEPLGARHTTHLRVFTKTDAGWKIVSHLISDARQ